MSEATNTTNGTAGYIPVGTPVMFRTTSKMGTSAPRRGVVVRVPDVGSTPYYHVKPDNAEFLRRGATHLNVRPLLCERIA